MKFKIAFASAILLAPLCALADGIMDGYSNERYMFYVEYPRKLLLPQGEAGNGDGQVFASRSNDAELRTWGRWDHRAAGIICRAVTKFSASNKEEVTYESSKRNVFIASGYRGTKIFYRKVIDAGERCLTFSFEYDIESREKYDSLVAKMAASFQDIARH